MSNCLIVNARVHAIFSEQTKETTVSHHHLIFANTQTFTRALFAKQGRISRPFND